MNLADFKSRQLTAAGTHRVYGHEIALESDKSASAQARRGWRPIHPCFCVHDSPDSPCPCMESTLWWIPEDAFVAKGKTDRKDGEGRALQFFDISLESTILVETVKPVSVKGLKERGGKADSMAECDCKKGDDAGGVPQKPQTWLETYSFAYRVCWYEPSVWTDIIDGQEIQVPGVRRVCTALQVSKDDRTS